MPENNNEKRVEKLYDRALYSIETGQYDYAITLLKNALSINPNFTKAQEGIRLAKTRQLQNSSLFVQKLKTILFLIQVFFCESFKKYEKALDKYETLFALTPPPSQMLPNLGDVYMANGMAENAALAYKAVLQTDSNNIHVLRQLGKIYLNQGKMAEAKPIYKHLSSLAPNNGIVVKEVKDAYALMTIDKGGWEDEVSFRKKLKGETSDEEPVTEQTEIPPSEFPSEQARLLRKRLEKDSGNTVTRKELANLLLKNKRFDEAISEYRKIANSEPDDVTVIKTLADLYKRQGNIEKVIKEYEKLNNLSPDEPDILNTLGALYNEQDAPEKAIEVYRKIIELNPDNPDSHEALGKLYEHTRYFDKAIDEYEKVVNLDPERIRIEENIGNLYLRDGKSRKAIEKFEKVVTADKTNMPMRKVLGDLYMKGNQIAEAEKLYKEILENDPGEESAKARLQEIETVQLDRKIKQIDEQIAEYEKLIDSEENSLEVKEKLKEAKLEMTNLSILAAKDRIKVDPDNLKLHYQLGMLYREKGDIDNALQELQLSVNDKDKGAESLHMIGLCFEEKNMLDIAVRQLEKAEPSLPVMDDKKKAILYDLGRVYEKMGQPQKALNKYKEIYETDISYKDVSTKIEQAYQKK